MVLSLFGFGANPKRASTTETTVRALPASWYTSCEMYELERRAVFSKKWMLITHSVQFQSPGDWYMYTVAGYEFILCQDRSGAIKGFHNVCRHRAFPIVNSDCGKARIFACKYHGWSYGLDGKLAKAPGYQELEDFDKSKNSLFPVHVHIDVKGFVWVNLDASETPDIPWEDDFSGVDRQPRLNDVDFSEYQFDHKWEIEGDFNWKVLADNYNECYHCATAHPDVASLADVETYAVDTKGGHIQHFTNPEQRKRIDPNLSVASTFYFPNASMTVTPHFFFIQRVVPTSASKTFMRYEVYRHKDANDTDFEAINAMFKRIMAEDKWLCIHTQKNLNAGVFVCGQLHPRLEKGPLYFQQSVRELVQEHHRKEKTAGHEIWPVKQKLPDHASVSQSDVDFCSGLACGQSNTNMVW